MCASPRNRLDVTGFGGFFGKDIYHRKSPERWRAGKHSSDDLVNFISSGTEPGTNCVFELLSNIYIYTAENVGAYPRHALECLAARRRCFCGGHRMKAWGGGVGLLAVKTPLTHIRMGALLSEIYNTIKSHATVTRAQLQASRGCNAHHQQMLSPCPRKPANVRVHKCVQNGQRLISRRSAWVCKTVTTAVRGNFCLSLSLSLSLAKCESIITAVPGASRNGPLRPRHQSPAQPTHNAGQHKLSTVPTPLSGLSVPLCCGQCSGSGKKSCNSRARFDRVFVLPSSPRVFTHARTLEIPGKKPTKYLLATR